MMRGMTVGCGVLFPHHAKIYLSPANEFIFSEFILSEFNHCDCM